MFGVIVFAYDRYLFTVTSRSCHCFYVENFLVHFTNTLVYLAVTLFSHPHSLLLEQTVVGLVLVKKIKRNVEDKDKKTIKKITNSFKFLINRLSQ